MMYFLSCLAFCIIGSINAIQCIHPMPPTEPPLIQGYPFVVIWNAPINQCQQLEIPLDFAAFKAVTTPAAVPDQFVTMFYEDRLGLYPKVDHDTHNGGVPQNGNLTGHLSMARSQIHYYISQKSSHGLAVIDWESWRPLWDQNWGSKRIYQSLSISHALQIAPGLSSNIISRLAKQQFQEAGWRFMEKTIHLGISQRPNRRWGFYLFPDCFNYGWKKPDYTGECSMKTQNQNDEMMWLWESSTALFPSIYLPKGLMNSPKTKLFVRNRVQEALRVATLPKHPYTMPIYVFSRPLYRDQTKTFESKMDLENTIGESAALGASGVIMWGATNDYNSKAACRSLSEYLTSTLNPYIANVTAAAMLCSEVLCQGKGRCIRKSYNSTHCLHLNPANFCIKQVDGKYVATGQPSVADLDAWAENFTCQCYTGWSCSPNLVRPAEIKTIRI